MQAVGKSIKSKIAFKQFLIKMIGIFEKIYPEIKFDFSKNFKDFFVYGSLEDMEEVIGNLLENGCKYGKKIVRISIIKISDVEIKIEISDDGEGLPQKNEGSICKRLQA